MKYRPLLALGLLATPAFADDVNVKVQPLANETAISGTVDVDLICTIQYDASLNACKLADGAKVSNKDEDTAITQVNGKSHVPGPFVAGVQAQVKVWGRACRNRAPMTPFLSSTKDEARAFRGYS